MWYILDNHPELINPQLLHDYGKLLTKHIMIEGHCVEDVKPLLNLLSNSPIKNYLKIEYLLHGDEDCAIYTCNLHKNEIVKKYNIKPEGVGQYMKSRRNVYSNIITLEPCDGEVQQYLNAIHDKYFNKLLPEIASPTDMYY
jgi:hypothetical protein